MSKNNIVFDARWLESGGIGRFCQEIMQSHSIQQADRLEGEISDALSATDPLSISTRFSKGQYFVSPGYNCPLLNKGRAIVTLHDLMHLKFPGYSSLKNSVYYRLLVKRAVRSAPLVFTVSEFSRHEIADWAGIAKEKIVVVPNGVDHDAYHSAVAPMKRSRPYFFYVGNNKPHKNLPRLLDAFSESGLAEHMDLLLSCAPTAELERKVEKLGLSQQAVFLNGVEEHELPSYYKGAQATVVVSLYEGFCLPVLESMAVGTPVITSNVTAMPDTAGDAALLVDPYRVDEITASFRQLYEDRSVYDSLSAQGLKRAATFSWQHSREIWDKALTNVVERS